MIIAISNRIKKKILAIVFNYWFVNIWLLIDLIKHVQLNMFIGKLIIIKIIYNNNRLIIKY